MRTKDHVFRIDKVNWRGVAVFQRHEDNTLNHIRFKSTYNSHQVSFDAHSERAYKLQIGDFGFYEQGKCIQAVPTIYQIETMEDAIANEIERLRSLKSKGLVLNN